MIYRRDKTKSERLPFVRGSESCNWHPTTILRPIHGETVELTTEEKDEIELIKQVFGDECIGTPQLYYMSYVSY